MKYLNKEPFSSKPATDKYRQGYDAIEWKEKSKKKTKVKLLKNAIKCLKCGDEIESKHTHDFVMCSCGACFVDGGLDYSRGGGNTEDYKWIGKSEEVEIDE